MASDGWVRSLTFEKIVPGQVGGGRTDAMMFFPYEGRQPKTFKGGQNMQYMAGFQSMAGNALTCTAVYDGPKKRWSFVGNAFDRANGKPGNKGAKCNVGYNHWESFLDRASDTAIQPFHNFYTDKSMVIYRKDLGTPSGWREIR